MKKLNEFWDWSIHSNYFWSSIFVLLFVGSHFSTWLYRVFHILLAVVVAFAFVGYIRDSLKHDWSKIKENWSYRLKILKFKRRNKNE